MGSTRIRLAALGMLLAVPVASGQDVRPADQPAPSTLASPLPAAPIPNRTVTTQSPEYCVQLAREVDVTPDSPEDARTLVAEGERMCREGHVVGGIGRLRRAFLLTHPDSGFRGAISRNASGSAR